VSVLQEIQEEGGEDNPPALVAWQTFPLTPPLAPYNWDIYVTSPNPDELNPFVYAMNTGNIYIATPITDRATVRVFLKLLFDVLLPEEKLQGKERPSTDEPITTIVQPILVNEKVVATASFTLLWRELLEDLLPKGSSPVDVVASQCGYLYTFRVEGANVYSVGVGDLHERQFGGLGHRSDFVTNPGDAELPVNDTFCPSFITVYPTQQFVSEYTSDLSTILAGVVLAVFLVTSATFIIYDRRVERRQRLVLLEASKNATNEALLEEKVHERTHTLEEMNRELEKANRNIQHASEAQLRHFACMSHEIRTPLNCIMGCSSLLNATPLEAIQRDSVEMISSCGEELLSVINNVLEYSRLETGYVEIEMQLAKLQGILDESVWPVVNKSQGTKIITHFHVATPEYIRTDARRLQAVFLKLLQNAVSRCKMGDTVLFATRVDERRDVLTVSVRDQGPIMSEQDCANIHKPFRKFGESNSLGIAIGTKLIHQMGGTLKVHSDEGQGTMFVVTLPMSQDENPELKQALDKLRDVQLIMATTEAIQGTYVSSIARQYEIPIVCVSSQAEALKEDAKLEDSKQRIIVIQRDMYNVKDWQESSSRRVMTFGPQGESKDTTGPFCTNIREHLPTTLIHSLVTHLERPQEARPLPKKSSLLSEGDIDVPYASLRLLIAEDNVVNQKVLARLLNRLGTQNVSIVSNGQQAVDKEAEEEFDFVFMDMQMPIMDGLEATRCIQDRTEGHTRARIIFITAHALLDFQDQCFKAGGIEFVEKPCSMDSIDQCFKRIYLRDRLKR